MRSITIPGLPRARRLLRTILGPSTPVPDAELPRPSGILSASATLPFAARGASIDLDARLLALLTRLHIRSRRIVVLVLVPVLALWAMANVLLVREQYYAPGAPPMIGCTAAPWASWPPDVCGVNGTACDAALGWGEDGGEGGARRFRCPGGCRDTPLGNPRWIGGEVVNGEPLVVGGGDDRAYR
jgi:hypothetical protein